MAESSEKNKKGQMELNPLLLETKSRYITKFKIW